MDPLSVKLCYDSHSLYDWADPKFNIHTVLIVKVKEFLHRPIEGPEVSRRLSLPDFKTVCK